MSIRNQKAIFGFVVAWMLGGNLWAAVSCPVPAQGDLPLVFALGVASTLLPAFGFLYAARKLSEVR